MGRPFDTSSEAHERWLEALRAVEPAERLRLAAAMSDEIRTLAEAGIRHRRPELSHDEVNVQLAELLFGSDVARVARRPRPIISG